MNREIGSDFLIEEVGQKESLSIYKYIQQFGNQFEFTDSGRSAIKYVAKLSNKKTVLLPNYLCDSMIQPFKEENYSIHFYNIDKNLSPDLKSLNLDESPGVFVHMGYFGFYSNNNLEYIVKEFKKNGTIVLEDVTHTIFSKDLKPYKSDYYIASLRKWIGIPDGGVVISNQQINYPTNGVNHDLVSLKVEANKKKKDFISGRISKKEHLYLYKKAEEKLDNFNTMYNIDPLSLDIIKSYDFEEMIKKRRTNYIKLYSELSNLSIINIQNYTLDSLTPLFFPIRIVKSRNKVIEKLTMEKIYTPIHWPKPSTEKSVDEQKIYDEEISLLCDQRYNSHDMDRIVKIIKSIEGVTCD